MNDTKHLNKEQIDDVLIGDAGADTTEHLKACGECRERVAMVAAPILSFAALTLAWSERQSATMAAQPMKAEKAWPYRLNWALAAAVLLVAGLLLPVSMRDAHRGDNLAIKTAAQGATASVIEPQMDTQPVAEPVTAQRVTLHTVAAERSSSAEVARDNRMLAAIHDELDASVQSPEDMFGLRSAENHRGGGHGQNVPTPSLDSL